MKPYWAESVGPWVADRLSYGGPYDGPDCACMGVEHLGKVVAGIVFHNWEQDAGIVELSVASETKGLWATREVLNTIGDHAFGHLGCQMLMARQMYTNTPARALWTKLGASEHVVPRLFGRGTLGTVMFLTDDDWYNSKFYRGPNNGR